MLLISFHVGSVSLLLPFLAALTKDILPRCSLIKHNSALDSTPSERAGDVKRSKGNRNTYWALSIVLIITGGQNRLGSIRLARSVLVNGHDIFNEIRATRELSV